MAALTNINPPTLVPGAQPTTNTLTVGPDTIALPATGRFLFRFNNTGGAPITWTIDDPVSQTPASAKAWNPDVDVVVTNAQARAVTVDMARFRDPATGNVSITPSGAPTATLEIHGPF